MTTVAVCPACNLELPAASFHRNRSTKNGLARLCKQCINAYNRKREAGLIPARRRGPRPKGPADKITARKYTLRTKYGMSIERYNEILDRQNGVCMICQGPEIALGTNGRIRSLAVDHDHACCPGVTTCGRCIRGLLCSRCNKGLGYFRDDSSILQSAMDYLKTSRPSELPKT